VFAAWWTVDDLASHVQPSLSLRRPARRAAITTKHLPHAFDLIELNGDDLRGDPLQGRKATLEMMLAKAPGLVNPNGADSAQLHLEWSGAGDAPTIQRAIIQHYQARAAPDML
jgi:ATP-dependent DNA ligase